MSDKLQIPHSLKRVHDAITTHLNLFESTHRDHFTYDRVREGFGIEYFNLRYARRRDDSWYGDAPDLGFLKLRRLNTKLTEMVIEESRSLEVGSYLFLSLVEV